MTPNVAIVPVAQRAVVTHRSAGAARAARSPASGQELDAARKDDEAAAQHELQDNG
jgi:hypothetical protein